MSAFLRALYRAKLMALCRKTVPIRTKSGLLIALLAGKPSAPTWERKMKTLAHAMDSARLKMSFRDEQTAHRRGDYPTVTTGISYGGGAMVGQSLTLPEAWPDASNRNLEN